MTPRIPLVIHHAGRQYTARLVPLIDCWAWGFGSQSGIEPTMAGAIRTARDAVQSLENVDDAEKLEKAS